MMKIRRGAIRVANSGALVHHHDGRRVAVVVGLDAGPANNGSSRSPKIISLVHRGIMPGVKNGTRITTVDLAGS